MAHTCARGFSSRHPWKAAQVIVISLVALVEPQILDPFVAAPRPIKAADRAELTDLYRQAYAEGTPDPDPGKPAAGINAVFDGAHGALIPEASLLTGDAEGRTIAAIIITERVFGAEGPKTAFIAELFTDPAHRRQGLAEILLTHAMQALHETGHQTLAVNVNSSNATPMALYLSRDFRRFTPAATNA